MTETKTALITGISGQDGSYLTDLLVQKGYEVHGMVRRYSNPDFPRLTPHLEEDTIKLWEGDLSDPRSVQRVVRWADPDEVYNLAAQSNVGVSFEQPDLTLDVTGLGAGRVFEAVRKESPDARVYQASSSEMYGDQMRWQSGFLDETVSFKPVSPYGCAKVLAHNLAHTYRVAHDLHICCGILFNHESPRRGQGFVTRKITRALAEIKHRDRETLGLGWLGAKRDWGHARDYVKAMWKMLQQDEPDDWVIATGETHSVKDFLDLAIEKADMDLVDEDPRKTFLEIRDANMRPADIKALIGDASKAREELDWEPEVTFEKLVEIMVEADIERVKGQRGAR